MESPPLNAPSIEALESVHSFPGPYTIKAIGGNNESFAGKIEKCVKDLLDTNEYLQLSNRKSSKGNHISLTLKLHIQSAEKVRFLYTELKKVEGLRLLL